MNEFRSSIFDAVVGKLTRNIVLLFVLWLTSSIVNYSALIPFEIGFWTVVMAYLFLFIIQIFITNNDLIIEGDEIIIHPSLFKSLREKRFQKDEISKIIFKDEWSESFMNNRPTSIIRFVIVHFILMLFIPWEYKWITISTKNNQNFKYFFFGLNYDFHDNAEEVLFEDMFIELAKRNINVQWKSTKVEYFKGIQESADEILSGKW